MTILIAPSAERLLIRYRLWFKAAIAGVGAGIFLASLGILALIFASTALVLGAGLLLAAVSGLNAYRIALSTMKIIDRDGDDRVWQNLST